MAVAVSTGTFSPLGSPIFPLIGQQPIVDSRPKHIVFFGDSIAGAASTNSTGKGTAYNITGITNAASAVVTENGATLSSTAGDEMFIHSCLGMTEINEQTLIASAGSATTVTLPIDSTAVGTFTGGGMIYRKNNAVFSNLAQGIMGPVNNIMGQRFIFDHSLNRGVGGNTTTDMNNRKEVALGNLNFDIAALSCVTNDIGTSSGATPVALSTIQANTLSIVNYVTVTLGKAIILLECPPADDQTATQIQRRKDYNTWIATLEAHNVMIARFYNNVADGSDNWIAGASYDGVHPAPIGSVLIAFGIRDAVKPKYGMGDGFILQANNKLLNPYMTGTGGTLSGAGATNNGIATSWTVETAGTGAAGTKVLSKNSNDNQRFATSHGSGLSTGERVSSRQDVLAAELIVNRYYVAEAWVQIVSGSGTWYEASLEMRNNSSGFAFDNARRNYDPLAISQLIADESAGFLHLKTQPTKFLTGWTFLRPRCNMTFKCDAGAATGTMDILAQQLYEV